MAHTIRIAGTARDSIVDGPGLRFTVFTQGCPHHCPGCQNPHTHDPGGGYEIQVEELAGLLASDDMDGLTLSGGEPFLQGEGCAALARRAHALGLNVWTYTGYPYEELAASDDPARLSLLAETDVLVDGPFIKALQSHELPFRGSSNQRLIDLKKTRREGSVILWTRPALPLTFTVPES